MKRYTKGEMYRWLDSFTLAIWASVSLYSCWIILSSVVSSSVIDISASTFPVEKAT